MPHEKLLSLKNVGLRREGRWIVRNVSIDVGAGEIVTLIGPNGSGKSTLVKLGLGILEPNEGKVSRSPNTRIGYVPQRLVIDRTVPLSVRRLIDLGAKRDDRSAEEALEAVGIPDLVDAQVQTLSGGEFQRALLARAIAGKPDLLVLDEPVQGVDFAGELLLYELISTIRDKTGCCVLLVSHDLHVVMAATDTVICLNGHVCCTGSPEAVAANPEYTKLFGTRAVDALAIYRHHHDHTHLPDGRVQHKDGSITDHCHPSDGHHHA